MNNFKAGLAFFFVAFQLIVFGCSNERSQYLKASQDFNKGVESISQVMKKIFNDDIRNSRMLAIAHFAEYRDSNKNISFQDSQYIDESFSRLACISKRRSLDEKKQLLVLSSYSNIINDLSKEPSKEVGKLWKEIKKLKKDNPEIKVFKKDGEKNPFNQCLKLVRSNLPTIEKIKNDTLFNEPFTPGEEAGPAAVFAAIEIIGKIIDSIEGIAKTVLTTYEESIRVEKIRKFVRENSGKIDDILNDGLKKAKVQIYMNRQIKGLLVSPYYKFLEIGELSKKRVYETKDKTQIVRIGKELHRDLEGIDVLTSAGDLVKLRNKLVKAQATLHKMATNPEFSASDGVAQLKAFAKDAKNIIDNFNSIKENGVKLVGTF